MEKMGETDLEKWKWSDRGGRRKWRNEKEAAGNCSSYEQAEMVAVVKKTN